MHLGARKGVRNDRGKKGRIGKRNKRDISHPSHFARSLRFRSVLLIIPRTELGSVTESLTQGAHLQTFVFP
jgi:hypothetical protein